MYPHERLGIYSRRATIQVLILGDQPMLKKIVSAGVGFSVLAVPLLASADTISDLQAQLRLLTAQIQALQTSQPTNTTVSSEDVPDDYGTGSITNGIYCPKLTTTLQKGSRDVTTGGQVSELQTFLTDYFNLDENVVVGGYFGNLTHSYVVKFQMTHGLPSLGIVGSLTRTKISAVCGGSVTPSPEAAIPVIKISASPSTVTKGGTSVVSWSTQNATRCWVQHGVADSTQFEETVATQGQKQFNPYVNYKVTIGCANELNFPKDGPQSSASVIIIVTDPGTGTNPSASAQIVSPNGGEVISRDTQMKVYAKTTGVKSFSLALYKNDQLKSWLVKDTATNSDANFPITYSLVPSVMFQGLGEGDNAGAIWKIHIIGQKADGSGYVEDVSDSAFTFIPSPSVIPSCTITTNKTSYSLGETINAKWVSTNASYANWVQDTSGKDALKLPGDKLEISGYQQILASVIGNPNIVMRVTSASGQTNTCSTAVAIGPPVIDSSADIKFNGQDNGITVHVGDAPFQMTFTTKNVYSCTATVMGPMPSGPSSFPTSYSGPSGGIVVGLVGTTNFLFSCTTPSGGLVSDSIQMTVLPPASAATNSGTEANLASALTALQSVLEKLVAELSQ